MPPRNAKRGCLNCPLPTPPPSANVEANQPITMADGLKLWKHVLFGTGTCIGMIHGYAALKMPGNPLEGVKHLRDNLNQIIKLLEDQANAPTDTTN